MSEGCYDPEGKGRHGMRQDWEPEESQEYLTVPSEERMRVKQGYADTFPRLFACRRCGGKEFNVASEEYFTAIRCPKCLWEVCIHDG